MTLDRLNIALEKEIEVLKSEGRSKAPERIIVDYIAPKNGYGPRYKLAGSDLEFIRMNSNSYLSLSQHPRLVHAADLATHTFGVGPGAVRFIDGTFQTHIDLESRVAKFVGKPAAKIFNSAYTSNLGLALTIDSPDTFWIGDSLNHNSIIRAMRISGVPRERRAIYQHNDMHDLKAQLDSVPENINRVVVIFDGVFSMRGDCAPIGEIQKICSEFDSRFSDGVITVVDDSHGIGALGKTGRGTSEHTGTQPDIIVGTFGKAFGVNGGFIAGSPQLVEAVRQKADTYIYTNPLSVADCAAAIEGINIADSAEGISLLQNLRERTLQFREGLKNLDIESIEGPHPVVPVMVRDTQKTHAMVKHLFESGVLVVGLTFPVVPKGNETIRVQLNAAHTEKDVSYVLETLEKFK